jgi:ribosomal protein L44E
MKSPVVNAVHCPTCRAPAKRNCHSMKANQRLRSETHAARRRLYERISKLRDQITEIASRDKTPRQDLNRDCSEDQDKRGKL